MLLTGTKLFGTELNLIGRGNYGKGCSLMDIISLGGKSSQFKKICLVSGQNY